MQSAFQRALGGMRWCGRVRRDTNGKKESGSGLKTPDHGFQTTPDCWAQSICGNSCRPAPP